MAQQDLRRPATTSGDGPATWEGSYGAQAEELSLGELLKRLSNDAGELISQEISLAKAELKESATNIGKGATKFGVALAFGFVGLIAITAFMVIGLGNATGGYEWWALGVGAAEMIIAGIAAKSAMSSIKPAAIKPADSIDSLREDKSWAKREARDLKHDLATNPTTKQSVR
jgi:uncharacterized membrane protein YqjE